MTVTSKLSEKDYINASFVLLYSRTTMKLFTGFVLFFLLVSLLTLFFPVKGASTSVIMPLLMLIVFPLMTYLGARRNYRANKRAGETVEYHFDESRLIVRGESFSTEASWDKVYRVTKTKNWIFIWQNRQIANPIPRKVWQEKDFAALKEILDRYQVKNNL